MLTALQQQLVQAVRELPQAEGFALAGGAGLIAQGTSSRPTNDLDFFAESSADVDQFLPILEGSLRDAGLKVERITAEPGFARLSVGNESDQTLIDLAYDARLFAPVETDFGLVLALDELAADKTLAVFGRAEARDFVDLMALSEHYGLDELIELASAKDAGFDLAMFRMALGSISRHPRAIFQVSDHEYEMLQTLVSQWRTELGRNIKRNPGPEFDGKQKRDPGRDLGL